MIEALSREQVAELIWQEGAVETGPHRFKYHDRHPDAPIPQVYFNIRGDPDGPLLEEHLRCIGHHMAAQLLKEHPRRRYDLVAGLPNAGLPLAEAFKEVWPYPIGLLRLKKVRVKGGRRIIPVTRDSYQPGMSVLILDDLLSTAATKIEGIEAVRTLGLVVKFGVVLVSYGLLRPKTVRGVKFSYSFTVSWAFDHYSSKEWWKVDDTWQIEEGLRAFSRYIAAHQGR